MTKLMNNVVQNAKRIHQRNNVNSITDKLPNKIKKLHSENIWFVDFNSPQPPTQN